MTADESRYLGRTLGYASYPTVDGLEAVDEREQLRQTRAAHERWRRELQRTWGEAAATINEALDAFAAPAEVHHDHHVMSGVRAVRRSAQALGRRLGA